MSSEKITYHRQKLIEADSFTGMHLNETGPVEDFIEKLKAEIVGFDSSHKNEFILLVIRRVNHEKDWHCTLCALEDCTVKQYFDKCLDMLQYL
jgi:hypothetical protein